MQNLIESVSAALNQSGFVQIEVSARHVHLTREAVAILFGEGESLAAKRELSQPGQFLSQQRVNLIGGKTTMKNIAVLGPERSAIQVELSKSDCLALGVSAPIRESGDVNGSGGDLIIQGPLGEIQIKEGVIVARAHIHVTPEVAASLSLQDKAVVSVEVLSDRPVTFHNVSIRVSDKFRYRMHVDFDEANAAAIQGFVLGKIKNQA